jgi:hypothetical protein
MFLHREQCGQAGGGAVVLHPQQAVAPLGQGVVLVHRHVKERDTSFGVPAIVAVINLVRLAKLVKDGTCG